MIVKRAFVKFDTLLKTDPAAAEVIEYAFRNSYHDNYEHIKKQLIKECLYQCEMGWAMKEISYLIESFERLDRESPYDSGYTCNDIAKAKPVYYE